MGWFEAPAPLLPELIARHGKWRAARTALVAGEQRLSWAQFAQATAQIANGLSASGLARGDRIAILMDNSLEMALLLFGILRSGCVAVPLNVSISDAAVAAMIEDAAARAVFASGPHCARIDALAAQSAQVRAARRFAHLGPGAPWQDFNAWRAAQLLSAPQLVPGPDDLCNIIYSSGTTGHPKGIEHSHRCRLTWAVELALMLRYRSDCVTLCSLGLFSNISWVAMLATVLVGGTIVVMPHFEARAAAALIEREHITHGTFVPLQLERLLALPDFGGSRVASLDTVMCCGSPLKLEIKREFPRRTGCTLIELYGLTEGLCTILAPEDFAAKTVSVGKPFLGTDLKILGEDDRELEAG
ncbi:MAG TPA: long-chain fatty acid--CoA ligase, partial [Solirubrobacteraceae bacterium]|nr:long-chain fatty acid--CoA ligase [Solirubrobacteraceae bacterium]